MYINTNKVAGFEEHNCLYLKMAFSFETQKEYFRIIHGMYWRKIEYYYSL